MSGEPVGREAIVGRTLWSSVQSTARRSAALTALAGSVALLLIVAPHASAAGTITITGGGTGTGTVTSIGGGTPLNCHIVAGVASGECTTFANNPAFEEIVFLAAAEGGSAFTEWEFSGEGESLCAPGVEPTNPECITAFKESESATLKAQFAAPPPPAVTGVSPAAGPTAGGTMVTVSGEHLLGASKVAFGGDEITCAETVATCKVESATEIKTTTPAHAAGPVDVVVTTDSGSSPTTADDIFTYAVAPSVTGISPSRGSTSGGNVVTISGTKLAGATQVEFGSSIVGAPFVEATASMIKVIAPEHAAGAIDVRVLTPAGGLSAPGGHDSYRYLAPPAILAVNPASGSTAGGSVVEITGLRLSEATKVEFGSTVVSAPPIENTASGIKVIAPPHEPGTVDVRVTTDGGISGTFPQDHYTYATPSTPILSPPPSGTTNSAKPSSSLPPAGTPEVATRASVRGGKAELKVTCGGTGACSGSFTLKAKVGGKTKVIGKSSYSVAAGKSKTIRVKIINGKVLELLNKGKSLKTTLIGPGLRGKVTLSRAKQ